MRISSMIPWKEGIAPMAWRKGRIYYHTLGRGKLSKSYSCRLDGSDVRSETFSEYPVDTHEGIEDVAYGGTHALTVVERANHWPIPNGDSIAMPGAGTYNDLWVANLSTRQTWKVVDLTKTRNHALIWSRFNSKGTKITWTELHKLDWQSLGSWTLNVADIVYVNGVPKLMNRKSRVTDGFVEAYGFTDGDKNVLAASTLPGLSPWNSQIVKFPILPSVTIGEPVRLTPKVAGESLIPFINYCEFAWTVPAYPNVIMYGRTYGSKNGSIEFWTMTQDGRDHSRLTFTTDPKSSQYLGDQILFGGVAFNPNNPKQFVAAYVVNFDPSKNLGDYKSLLITLE